MGKCFMGQAGQMANVIHRTKTKSNDPERPVLNKPESVDLSDNSEFVTQTAFHLSSTNQRPKNRKAKHWLNVFHDLVTYDSLPKLKSKKIECLALINCDSFKSRPVQLE